VCRYESHKQFFNDCVSHNIILKGFDLKWKMDLPLNEAEIERITDVLRNASFFLMSKGLSICERILAETQETKREYTSQLESLLSKTKFSKDQKELEMFVLKTEVELQRTKKKKIRNLKEKSVMADNVIQRNQGPLCDAHLPSDNRNAQKQEVVTNLSKKRLMAVQLALLSRGLKFVPTRRNIDKGKLITDLAAWERRMRLKEYFFTEEEEDGPPEMDKPYRKTKPSTWTPKAGRDKWLDAYIKAVKEDFIAGLNCNFKLNITKEEERAMKELLSDDEIVIRPADKGSDIVVMDRDEYVQELQGEMSDCATYEAVPGDRTRTVQNKVKNVVDTLYKKGSIDNDLRRYMTGYEGTSGKLQGNPKLHKPGMPLRTIVNGRNHPTEKMAEIVEDDLREHVTSLP